MVIQASNAASGNESHDSPSLHSHHLRLSLHAPSPQVLSLVASLLAHFHTIPLTQLALICNLSPITHLSKWIIPYMMKCAGEDVLGLVNVGKASLWRRSGMLPGSKLDADGTDEYSPFWNASGKQISGSSFTSTTDNRLIGKQVEVFDLMGFMDWCEGRDIPVYPLLVWKQRFNLNVEALKLNGIREWIREERDERYWRTTAEVMAQNMQLTNMLEQPRPGQGGLSADGNGSYRSTPSQPLPMNSATQHLAQNKTALPHVTAPPAQPEPFRTTIPKIIPTPTISPSMVLNNLLYRFNNHPHFRYCMQHYSDLSPHTILHHLIMTMPPSGVYVPGLTGISLQVDSLFQRLSNNIISHFTHLIHTKDASLIARLFHYGQVEQPQLRFTLEEMHYIGVHQQFLLSVPLLSAISRRELQNVNWSVQWWFYQTKLMQDSTLDYIPRPYSSKSRQQKEFYFKNVLSAEDRAARKLRPNPTIQAHPNVEKKYQASIISPDSPFVHKFFFFEGRSMNIYRKTCDHILKSLCDEHRQRMGLPPNAPHCPNIHYRKLIYPHTRNPDQICKFKNNCRYVKFCKLAHVCVDERSEPGLLSAFKKKRPFITDLTIEYKTDHSRSIDIYKYHAFIVPSQWICCDIRHMNLNVFGKYDVIMADPPWDISLEYLTYGTMADTEIKNLHVDVLQDVGYMFMWVTTRAIEFGYDLLKSWGYTTMDQHIVWIKTSCDYQPLIEGTTGHYLNHSKEHLLIGRKGYPRAVGHLDVDVIMSAVRESSRKPDEIYSLIERLFPHSRKLELFGRNHNRTAGWITLGNQLSSNKILDPALKQRLADYKALGGKGLIDVVDCTIERV